MEVINLNLIPSGVLPVCHAKQFDKGRVIRINLFNGTAPLVLTGAETVSVNVRKPDKHIVTANLTNTSDSYVEVETTEQMVAVAGANLCDIKIVGGLDEIGTLNFKMEVQEDPLNGGLASDSEINNLQTQVGAAVATELATQYDSANVVFDSAPTAGHNAPYAVTSEGVKNAISAAVPTKTSDLTNDSGFITNSAIPATYDADDINYDNSLSGLTATDAQAAIDELAANVSAVPSGNKTITGLVVPGYITGSGNYFVVSIPVKNKASTVSLVSIGQNTDESKVFTPSSMIQENFIDLANSSVQQVTNDWVTIEFKFADTQTPNLPITAMLFGLVLNFT